MRMMLRVRIIWVFKMLSCLFSLKRTNNLPKIPSRYFEGGIKAKSLIKLMATSSVTLSAIIFSNTLMVFVKG